MDEKKFKEKIYGPYTAAWKIIKILQFASDDNPELFLEYMNRLQEFEDAYKGNEFAELIRKALLLRADDIIAKMNRRPE